MSTCSLINYIQHICTHKYFLQIIVINVDIIVMQIACMMSNTVVSEQIYPYEKLIFVFSTKIGYMHANIIMLRDDTNMTPCKDW